MLLMRPSAFPLRAFPGSAFPRTASALAVLLAPALASAHITLTDPPARHPAADLKEGPCGVGAGDSRTTDPNKITEYMAGETIDITFNETFQHEGHYRVMLSSTGDAGFTDPTGYEDIEVSPGDLADGVMDSDSETAHTITVTLPDEPCEECTIQLIQVMYDKPPWGPEPNPPNGADIYYQCADIVILPGAGGGSGGASSGGATSSGGSDTGTGGLVGSGGVTGSGGVVGASGGAVGSGGVATGSGGVPAGSGGAIAASGGAPGSGGEGTLPPSSGSSCSLSGPPAKTSGAWLALAGLGWLLTRRRRAPVRAH